MICSDCRTEIKDLDTKYRKLTVKGITFRAKTTQCPKCGQSFIGEEDIEEAMDNYEKAIKDDRTKTKD